VEAGLIGSIDDSGNCNGIEIAADSSCFIEDRLVPHPLPNGKTGLHLTSPSSEWEAGS
jgi:hypothetical protein